MKLSRVFLILFVSLSLLGCSQAAFAGILSAAPEAKTATAFNRSQVAPEYSEYVEGVLGENPSPAIRIIENPGGITDFLCALAKWFGPSPISSLLIIMDFYWVKPGFTMMYGMDTDDLIISDRYDMIWGIYRGYDVMSSANGYSEKPGYGIKAFVGSESKKIAGGPDGDLFILGDWLTPYHANREGPAEPEKDFVYIYEFNALHSTIRLHGSPDDYILIPTNQPQGTGIALVKEGYIDLVAWVAKTGASELDLNNAKQFWFTQEVGMEPAVKGGLQFGGRGLDGIHVSTVDEEGSVYAHTETGCSLYKFDVNMNLVWHQTYNFSDGSRLFHRMLVDGEYLYTSGYFEDNQVMGLGGLNANVMKIDRETGEITDEIILFHDPKFHSTAWNLTKDNAGNLYVGGGTGGKSIMWDLFPLLSGITPEKVINAVMGIIRYLTTDAVLLPAVSPFVAKVRMSDMSLEWVDIIIEEEDKYNPFNFKFSVECLGGIAFIPDGSGVPGKGHVYNSGYAALGSYFGEDHFAWDNFTLKHDDQGNLVWGKGWGAKDVGDTAWDMEADGEGCYYVVGATHGPINGEKFHGDADGYIVKYDSDHNPVWTRLIGAEGSDEIHGCALHDGVIYFFGWTMSDLAGPNAGWYDLFVGKVDSDGNLLGLTQFGTEQIEVTYNGFDVDGVNDRIYITGGTEGSLAGSNQGSTDAFIVALDAETLDFVDLVNGGTGPARRRGDQSPAPFPEKKKRRSAE